ncbi:HSP90 family protein [Psychromicrobium xiongbiense]|uniref:HSP90 family protein n=1 Tax=Psychromicrobium xiongbiense TaxID=3051184 RepID=UPI002556FC6B|nr:HSP90 family protein [Psychromicrobium sp. YIM S02556]
MSEGISPHGEELPFQVDLRGVVDLLSRHIYSTPQVFLRELLQNGVDAVAARALEEPTGGEGLPAGRITLNASDGVLTVTDNGVGLTLEEAAQLLATVGRSSKRDTVLNLQRDDFLGQFGIGLLSCFLVTDRIVVRSRSARGGQPLEWCGSATGTFTLRALDAEEAAGQPVGTTVRLEVAQGTVGDSSLLSATSVRKLALRHGRYLPTVIELNGEQLNQRPVFLSGARTGSVTDHENALRELGSGLLGAAPLDVIPLDIPGTGTQGVAFILPSAPPPSAHQATAVYLGRMLLNERVDDLLPDWAFFVRCVINTTGLHPTASREQLVEDAALEFTREELGGILKRWIVQIATTAPRKFDQFLNVHQLALQSLVLHDEELAQLLLPWLSLETNRGRMSCRELVDVALESAVTVRYTDTVDEFRQIAGVLPAGQLVVNGGYTHDSDLVRRLAQLNPQLEVSRIQVTEVLDELQTPPLQEREATNALEQRAEAALAEVECAVSVRLVTPKSLPALYVVDPQVLRRMERGKAAGVAPTFWAGILADLDRQLGISQDDAAQLRSRLCLNWASPLIRELASVEEDLVFDRTIRLLYVQAMLEGHRPLAASDRALLTSSLTDLIHLSAGAGSWQQP